MSFFRSFCISLLYLALGVLLTGVAPADAGEIQFGVSRLHLEGMIQFVLPAELDGRSFRELLVYYIGNRGDGNPDKRLAVFKSNDGVHYDPNPYQTISIDPGTGSIDVADLDNDGLDDIVVSAGPELKIYPQKSNAPDMQSPGTVLRVSCNLPYSRTQLFRFHLVRDLNHDGRGDILVPVMGGFALLLQDPSGRFPHEPTQILPLGYSSTMREYGGRIHIEYRIPAPTQLDFTGDGVSDLVFADGNLFHFFPFEPAPGVYGAPKTVKIRLEQTAFGRLHSEVDDVDSDGIPDILIMRVAGKKILTNEFYLFRGRPGLSYGDKEDQRMIRKGSAETPVIVDLSGDQRKELITSTVNVGLSLFVDYFMRNRVGVDISVYRIVDKIYEEKPARVERIYFRTEEEEGVPGSERGDFNGDGLDDFALATHPDKLSFYAADPKVLLRADPACEVEVPSYGKFSVEDINGDGRDDIAIFYPVEKRKGDLTVLISK